MEKNTVFGINQVMAGDSDSDVEMLAGALVCLLPWEMEPVEERSCKTHDQQQ